MFCCPLCAFLVLITGCSNPSSQNLASLTVTATPATVSVGGSSVLKAVAHLTDGTTQDVTSSTQWTLSNPALATMKNGALTAVAPGAVMVQAAYVEATPAGTSPAAASTTPQVNLSASTQVTISSAPSSPSGNTPAISWSATAAIPYGTALSSTQLNATANVAGTFAYTPAAGAVLKAGTQTLSAVFTPADTSTYSSATATVQLTVNQASPTITWAAPAGIAAGTALSATQLDATANVPGTFVYNPAAGAVLTAGTQQLTAVFSPHGHDRLRISHSPHLAGRRWRDRRPGQRSCRLRRPDHQCEPQHERRHAEQHHQQRSQLCGNRLYCRQLRSAHVHHHDSLKRVVDRSNRSLLANAEPDSNH